MNKEFSHQLRQKYKEHNGLMKNFRHLRKVLICLLALTLTFGQLIQPVQASLVNQRVYVSNEFSSILTDAEYAAINQILNERLNRGLVGFVDDYALSDDETPVRVIVQFENSPAGVQVFEANLYGINLTYEDAQLIVDEEHELFFEELEVLLDYEVDADVTINALYREALNGVSMTVPSNLVAEIALFDSVRVIYPDVLVTLDPVDVVALNNAIENHVAPYIVGATASARVTQLNGNSNDLHITITEQLSDGSLQELPMVTFRIRNNASGTYDVHGYYVFVNTQGNTQIREIRIDVYPEWEVPVRNPLGMQPGRATMRADEMHALGYRGAGVVVAVLDTGVDYYHPAFRGAFLTLEQARERNPLLPDEAAIYGYFKGRNFVDDVELFPSLAGVELGSFDPMETTYEMWRHSGLPEFNPTGGGRFLTMHGTHVAGTIVGRDAGNDNSILGVAPEANMIAYRVLGPRGSGLLSGVILGIEYAVIDGADVVNMSLGGGANTPAGNPTTTAVSNAMLANPQITFVLSAGNSGPNYYTLTAPAPATPAITVSNVVESGPTGVIAEVNGEEFNLNLGSTPANSILISTSLFTIPRLNTTNQAPGPVPGVGTATEFAQLVEIHGLDALQDAYVLVRRGYAFVEVAAVAYELGLAGVIVINNTDANDASSIPDLPLPYLFIGLNDGINLYSLINYEEYSSLVLSRFIYSPKRLSQSSSRGPVGESFEIKPDIGANGTAVLSAVPDWWVGAGGGDDHTVAYALASGTSMSSPHVAGAVALLIDYSRQNASQWCAEEIKVRLMNTAIPFEDANYSVFDKGTGYVDVYAAAMADSFVYVTYNRVATELGLPFLEQDFVSVRTGSLSFGGIDIFTSPGGLEETLTATIVNTTNEVKTYRISYEFNISGREVQNPAGVATLDLSENYLTVNPHSTSNFDVTLTIASNAPQGFYEGYVFIYNEETLVAALPFAGVIVFDPPTLTDVFLYRPVISTGNYAQNIASSELGLFFTPHRGFGYNVWIYQDDNLVGFGGSRTVTNLGTRTSLPHRGIIFEGQYLTTPGVLPWNTLPEGEYVLVLEVFRQTTTGGFQFEKDVYLPFSVDNTAPVLTIENAVVNDEVYKLELAPCENGYVLLSGNVFDVWTDESNVEFDIWQNPQIINQSNNGVWIQVEDFTPVQVTPSSEGDFELLIPSDVLPANVTIHAIDNYSVIPLVDTMVGMTSQPWFNTGHDYLRTPGTFVTADSALANELNLAYVWPFLPNPLFNEHVWSGLNVTTKNISVSLYGSDIPVETSRSYNATSEAELRSAILSATSTGLPTTIHLLNDIELETAIFIQNNVVVTILGDVQIINRGSGRHLSTIPASNTVINIGSLDYAGPTFVSNASAGGINLNGATLNMFSGGITGVTTNGSGGAVSLISGATFNMYGGTISNNSVSISGAAVNVPAGSEFNFYDGLIYNNTSNSSGGAINLASGMGVARMNMFGGTIKNNSSGMGGAVNVLNNADLIVSGGEFINNVARQGGTVNVALGGNVHLNNGLLFGIEQNLLLDGSALIADFGNVNISDEIVLVAWQKPLTDEAPTYIVGSNTDLLINNNDVSIQWQVRNDQSGLLVDRLQTSRFIELPVNVVHN